jgi:hypothetical protein
MDFTVDFFIHLRIPDIALTSDFCSLTRLPPSCQAKTMLQRTEEDIKKDASKRIPQHMPIPTI